MLAEPGATLQDAVAGNPGNATRDDAKRLAAGVDLYGRDASGLLHFAQRESANGVHIWFN
jgi:hypothetical protein